MRLDLEETRSIEVEALDLTALGLFWWLVDRTWEQGGVPDDPALIRRALRGRIDGAAFDDAWRQVRPLMDAGSDNRIRIAWVERAREDTIGHLKTDAARKKAERLRAKAVRPPDVRVTPPDVRTCPAESPDRTDGRTGRDRTDEPQKPARKLAGGDAAELTRHVEAEFLRTRRTAYVHGGAKDGTAAAWLVKTLGLQEARRRATAMLDDPDGWVARSASLAFLRAQVNRWAPGVKPAARSGGSPAGEPSMRELFAQSDAQQARTVEVEGTRVA